METIIGIIVIYGLWQCARMLKAKADGMVKKNKNKD